MCERCERDEREMTEMCERCERDAIDIELRCLKFVTVLPVCSCQVRPGWHHNLSHPDLPGDEAVRDRRLPEHGQPQPGPGHLLHLRQERGASLVNPTHALVIANIPTRQTTLVLGYDFGMFQTYKSCSTL